MRLEILKQTSIRGRAVRPGDVVTAEAVDGRTLVLAGKAREIQSPSPVSKPATEARKPRPRKPPTD